MDAHDVVTLVASLGGVMLAGVLAVLGWLLLRVVANIDDKLSSLQNGQASHSRRLGNIEVRLGLDSEPQLRAAGHRHEKG